MLNGFEHEARDRRWRQDADGRQWRVGSPDIQADDAWTERNRVVDPDTDVVGRLDLSVYFKLTPGQDFPDPKVVMDRVMHALLLGGDRV